MKKILFIILAMTFMILLPQKVNAEVKEIRPVKSASGSAISIGSVGDISISQTSATIYVGGMIKLTVTGTNSFVMWKSDNKDVATVSKKGKVNGIKAGIANITAIIGAGDNRIKLTCRVNVISRLRTDEKNIICTDDEYTEVNIYCDNLKENELLYFDVNDSEVVSVDSSDNNSGNTLRIVPEKIGSTTITVYTGTSKKNINYDDCMVINVFVVEDDNWVTEGQLENCNLIPDFYNADFDYDSHIVRYNGHEILFRHENGYPVYLSVDDLKEAGIL